MSAPEQIEVSTIANEAFRKVTQAIVAGEFPPGEKLSEAELARRFGISRGPIREALGRLEGKLVSRSPRVGVRVIELTAVKLAHLFFVREALEGMAARLAATNMTDAEISALASLLDRHAGYADVSRGQAYFQGSHDDDFHFQIVRGARNPQLEQMLLEDLYYQVRLYRYRLSSSPGRAPKALQEHHAIVAALRARDPDAAEGAMRTHIRNAIASYDAQIVETDLSKRGAA